jgi:tetratricopeptide (TPR) repeat protein
LTASRLMQSDMQSVQERTGFVGRVQEQRQFLVALQGLLNHYQRWRELADKHGPAFDFNLAPGDDSYANIFLLHGIGGIGKSWLTRRCLMLADGIPNEPAILTVYDDVSIGAPVLEPAHLMDRLADGLARNGYEMYVSAYREARAITPQIIERVTRYQFEHRNEWDQLVDMAGELINQETAESGHLPYTAISLAHTHTSGVETSGRDAPTLIRAYDLLLQQMQRDALLEPDEAKLFRNPPAAWAEKLVTGLHQIAVRQPLVIGLDNLEIVVPLEALIRDCLVMPTNQSPIVWTLSGRHNLADERVVQINGENRVVKGYRDLLGENPPVVWDMSIFGDADLREYLEAESERRRVSLFIDDDIIEAIKATSSGVPLVVEMVTDALFTMDRDEFLNNFALDDRSLLPEERLNAIAERFLRYCLTQPDDLERVQAMALLRKDADHEALTAIWRLLPGQSVRDALHNLRSRYAFVLPEGLHDAVYEFVRRQLRTTWQASEARGRLGRRAAAFYETRWEQLQQNFTDSTLRVRDPHWQRATRDLLNALLWADPDQAVLFLLPRFVEGLGFDRAFSNGLLQQAEEFLTDSISTFSASYAALLHRMRVGLQNIEWAFDEPGEAIGAMLEGLLDAPGLSPLHVSILSLWQGNWLAEKGELDEALAAYDQAEINLPDEAMGLRQQLGKAFYEISSRFLWPAGVEEPVPSKAGLQAAERAITLSPEHAPAWFNYGVALDFLDRQAEAVEAFKQAVTLDPRANYYNNLGDVYASLEQEDEAIEAYQQAIRLDATFAWPYHNLGLLYAERGQLEDAIRFYQEAIEFHQHDRDRAITWDNFGDAHVLLGDHEEAISAYRWAGVLNPRFASPWYGLGNVYLSLERYREAIDAYQTVVTLEPEYGWAYQKLGSIYSLQGDFDTAGRYFEQAISHHTTASDEAISRRSLGDVYAQVQRPHDAIEAYRQAIKLDATQPETWNNLGDVYTRLENLNAALNAYQEAVSLSPEYAAAWDSLGDVFRLQERYPEATDAYEKVMAIEPTLPWPYHYLGDIAGSRDDPAQARDLYRTAIELHRNDHDRAVSWGSLGDTYLTIGDTDSAGDAYRAAIGLAPEYGWPYHHLAEIYELNGNYDLAVSYYRQAIERHDRNQDRAEAWFKLAGVYQQTGNDEEAAAAYRQVILLEPDDEEAWNNLGDCYLAQQRSGEAAEAYRQAISIDADYASPYHNLGLLATATNDYETALHYYRQAIERHEDDTSHAISLNKAGDTYLALNREDEAIKAYEQAIGLFPEFAGPYHSLGIILEEQQDYQNALLRYQRAAELYPADDYIQEQSRLWNGLGNVHQALDEPLQAISAYEWATGFDETFAEPWSNLADVYRLQGNFEQAVSGYERAIALQPELAHPYYCLGLISEEQKAYEPAVNWFKQALERYPANALHPRARAWNHLGNACRAQEQTQAAIEAYREAAALDANYFAPPASLGDIYSTLERYDEAIAAYRQAVAIDPDVAAPWTSLGEIYRTLKQNDKAIEAYQRSIGLDNANPIPHHGLGIIFEATGQLEPATRYYEQAISRYQADQPQPQALAWNGLGNTYRLQRQFARAVNAYQHATELAPHLAEPHHSLGLIYHNNGHYETAIIEFQRAIERLPAGAEANPDRAIVWNDLGESYSASARLENAVDSFRRAIELDKTFARPWYNLGDVHRTTGATGEAIPAYEQAIELAPDFAWAYNNLGLVYKQRNNFPQAETLIRQAIEKHTTAADKAVSWNNLGDVYVARNQPDKAVQAYQTAINLNPTFARPWKSLGDVYRSQGRQDGVAEAYQQAINLDPDYAWPYHGLGTVYKDRRAFPQAVAYYQQAIDRHESENDQAITWNGLGSVYLATRDYHQAIDAFQKAIQLNPDDAWPYHNLAFVNKQLGAYQQAIGLYIKAIDRFRTDQHRAVSWNNLGNVYTVISRFNEAIQAYETAISLNNAYALPWNSLGEVYLRRPQLDKAVTAFTEAIKRDNSYVLAWNNLGDAHFRQQRYEEAIPAYQKAIELDERFAWPYHNLGLLYDERGDYELALEHYQGAIDRHKRSAQRAVLSEKMADLYRIGGNTDKAIELLRNATIFDPAYASPWYTLGNIYAGLEQDTEAMQAYRRAIELNPDEAWSYHNLALLHEKQEAYREAIVRYQQAISRHRTDRERAISWDNLGNVYRDLNRLEDAVHAFQESIRLNPDYALPWNSLGDVYNALGNYPEAVGAYQRAIGLDPDYVWAYNSLGTVYINMGEDQQAIDTFDQVISRHGDHPEIAVSWNRLGDIYDGLEQEDKAISAYENAIKRNPDLAWPYNRLGIIYERRGNHDQAYALYHQATRRHRHHRLTL